MKSKVAIPLFGSRISPHFTYAEMALLVDIENGEVVQSREIALGPADELQHIQYFKSLDHQRYGPARGSKTHFVASGAVGDAKTATTKDQLAAIRLLCGRSN